MISRERGSESELPPLAGAQAIKANPEEESVLGPGGIYRLKPIRQSPYMRRQREQASQMFAGQLVLKPKQ